MEPLPDKYNSLLQKRPGDINLQIGVGKIKGMRHFIYMEQVQQLIKI